MKLFCLTYAGGNVTFYDQLIKELGSDMEVVAFEYSGHGQRHKEPFYKDFSELAEDMYLLIKENLLDSDEYALMGYSMGAISAVELLMLILKERKHKAPNHVFLAAHEPFTKKKILNFDCGEMDEYVINRTIEFGGISEKLINNKTFWRMYLPIYKADYLIIGRYDFGDLKLKTDISATVFYSESDTPFKYMQAWNRFFTKDCEFINYEGNHFFINSHCREMAMDIKKRIVM